MNITELDNVNTMNPYDTFDYNTFDKQDSSNYWENQVKVENKGKRKKVSFDDILSNMNLVVNKQGVLQFISPNQSAPHYESNHTQLHYYNSNDYPMQNQQTIYHPQNNTQKSAPLDPSVKHSYIYNKYFKDYSDPNSQKPEIKIPKTKEEYHQMLLENRIKAIEQKKRIEQIKSTKLLFTSAPGAKTNPQNIVTSKNNLRSMNFR